MEEEKHNSLRIDGLSNFNRAKSNSLKTFWMLIFLCFASACCYFLVDGVLTFAKFRLTTTYRLHAQTRTLFPTVAICNQNTLNSDYYVQLLEQTKATILKYDEPFYNLIVLESAYKNMTGEYLSQEQKMALFDWDGFVISCTFGNRACKPTHLRKSFFPYKLNCLLFNSGRDENNAAVQFEEVSVGGEAQSLTMELYVGLPDRIASIFTHRGASIGLFDINEDLYKNSPSPIYISPGLASKISVKRNVLARFNAWPYLYNECTLNKDDTLMQPIADSSLYDYAISTNFTYTRDSCILYCFNRLCAQRCNCTTVWSTNRLSGYSPCNDWQQLDCVSPFYYKEFLFGDFVARNCYSLCPLECNTRWFDKFSSLYAYPDQLYVAETLKRIAC